MKYKLKPKNDILKYLLGDVDQIDISYSLNSTYNTLLLCLNESLLDILYKYDQNSINFSTDQTDTGQDECLSLEMEVISDTVIKFNIKQKFVRCFSYYKEYGNNTNTNDVALYTNTKNFISLYPKLFLDSENTELNNLLTQQEKIDLRNSRLINVEFTDSKNYQIPTINDNASKGKTLPNYIELLSFIDSNLDYIKKEYTLSDSITNESHTIDVQYDENPNVDKYSTYAKTFNIINDSTILLDFEIYININKFKYLLDINDINIDYHINVTGDNIITGSTFNLDIYENINNYFNINDIIYIKNNYTDTVVSVCKITNIVNNKLTLSKLQAESTGDIILDYMDKYSLNKIKNLQNYNDIQQRNNILRKLLNSDLFVIDDIEFNENDYLAINNFG